MSLTFLPAVYESSFGSTLVFPVFWFLIILICMQQYLILFFSSDIGCGTPFHMFICHLYMVFGEMTFMIFGSFLKLCCFQEFVYFQDACVCAGPSVKSDPVWTSGLQPTRILCPWNLPGKNSRMGCHAFLQGTFQTQGSNPCLLLCTQILYPLNHLGSPCLR